MVSFQMKLSTSATQAGVEAEAPAISLPNPMTISLVRGAVTLGSTRCADQSAGLAGSNPVPTDEALVDLVHLHDAVPVEIRPPHRFWRSR